MNERDVAALLIKAFGTSLRPIHIIAACFAYRVDAARVRQLIDLATVKVTWDE